MRGRFSDYLVILSRRDPAVFLAASTVSSIGSFMTSIALPLAVYRMTGSVSLLALVWLLRVIASFVALPFGGVVADTSDRRGVMVACNLVSAVADVVMWMGFARVSLPLLLSGVTLLQASDRFFGPASSALFPVFFERGQLPVANSLRKGLSQVVGLVGPAIGGLLAEITGIGWLFLIDGASFILSTAMILTVHCPRVSRPAIPRSVRAFFSRLGEGLGEAAHTPVVVVYLLVGALGAVAARLFDIVGVQITQDVLKTGPGLRRHFRPLRCRFRFGSHAGFRGPEDRSPR